jgi:two-component system, sensor histidine kinase and response regulator
VQPSRLSSLQWSPALSPDSDALLKRAGFDIDSGVRRIGGKRDRYYLLLRKFAAQEAKAVETIRSALVAGDKTLAERTAHSLKGAASTLGVNALAAAAASVEAALKASRSLDGELDTLSQSLTAVVEAVRSALPEPVSGGAAHEVKDRVAVQQWLIRLKRLLENDDPEVTFMLAEAKPHLSPTLTLAEMRNLDSRIGEFDFGSALKCIASIGARLSLTLEGE